MPLRFYEPDREPDPALLDPTPAAAAPLLDPARCYAAALAPELALAPDAARLGDAALGEALGLTFACGFNFFIIEDAFEEADVVSL